MALKLELPSLSKASLRARKIGDVSIFPESSVRKVDTSPIFSFRLKSQLEMKRSLLINGPFLAGVKVYKSWFNKSVERSGFIPVPKRNERLMGGHAICIAGYDDKLGIFKFKNSWGAKWGSDGYGYLPICFVTAYFR